MPNVTVTSKGTNGIYVDFGDYEDDANGIFSPQGFHACFIEHIYDDGTGVVVKYEGRDAQTWMLCHTTRS